MPVKGVVELANSNVRFGHGVAREVGLDLKERGARRVLLLVDPNLVDLYPGEVVRASLEASHVEYTLFDRIVVEPTDTSFQDAIAAASAEPYDAFVAVGGGSTIDTAKAANLYSTHPADFLEYVTKPIGRATPPPGPLQPLIAIPTTTGTGSETTSVSVFDFTERQTKSVIGHRYLKPALALLDPLVTATLPSAVVASTGLDVFSHAIESLSAVSFLEREQPDSPSARPAYQGSNPIADIWALASLRLARRYLKRAAEDPGDLEARGNMLLAAAFAGLGFGSAGVHLPHAMSYPVSGRVKTYQPPGYKLDHPLVPHGFSVILTTPAVVRFMGPVCPERLRRAADALGIDVAGVKDGDVAELLADEVLSYMESLKCPNGLAGIGYTAEHIPALVEGTLPQKRIVDICPRPVDEESLGLMFEESMRSY